MWKIITLSSITLIIILVNSLIFFGINGSADTENLTSNLSEVQSKAKSSIVTPLSDEFEVPVRDNSIDRLVEIVLTSDDIKDADTKLTIGTETPYNTRYITEEEVKESISRIMGEEFDLEGIEKEYRTHVITLRNVEMKEGVTEKESKVKSVINEYKEKIGMEEIKEEDKVIGGTENSDGTSFMNDPYGVINDIMEDPTESDSK